MVWPSGWVCQAVRAPGVKWTMAAPTRDGGVGFAIVSMNTLPVNQSSGPGRVSRELRVICITMLLSWLGSVRRGYPGGITKRAIGSGLGACGSAGPLTVQYPARPRDPQALPQYTHENCDLHRTSHLSSRNPQYPASASGLLRGASLSVVARASGAILELLGAADQLQLVGTPGSRGHGWIITLIDSRSFIAR